MVATTAKTIQVSEQCVYLRAVRTDVALNVAGKFHGVVKDNRNDTGVHEDKEDKRKKLPSSPTVFERERELREELWVFSVIVL